MYRNYVSFNQLISKIMIAEVVIDSRTGQKFMNPWSKQLRDSNYWDYMAPGKAMSLN